MNSKLPQLAQGLELAMVNDFRDLDLPVYKPEDTIDVAGQAMVFEKASQVSLQLAAQIHWSNYHTWSYFRNVPEAEVPQHVSRLWDAVYPFATCLGMASQVTTTLRLALMHDKNLSKFASKVQLVSDTPAACNRGPARIRYHCITIIQLSDHVIVIDLVAQPTAFKVSLSSAYECRENLVPFAMGTGRWCYAYLSGPDHRRALVDCAPPPVDTEKDMSESRSFPFLDLKGGILGGVVDYAWPAANPTMETPLGHMPWRRRIDARSTWDYRPANIFTAYTTLSDGIYLVDTVSVIVDIVGQELQFQIPYADWLARPEHQVVHDRLTMELINFQRCRNVSLQDAVATCSLQLGSSNNVLDLPTHGLRDPVIKNLGLLDETCAALGLPEGEIMKIGLEVASFWKEIMVSFIGTPISMDLTQWLSSVQDLRRRATEEDVDSLCSDRSDVDSDKDFDSE